MEKARLVWGLLKNTERIHLKNVMVIDGKDRLAQVLNSFEKQEKDEVIFRKLWKKKNFDRNNFLLRNEFRLLVKEQRKIIVGEYAAKWPGEPAEMIWLRWIASRNAFNLFVKESNKILRWASGQDLPQLISSIHLFRFEVLKNQRELGPDLFAELEAEVMRGKRDFLKFASRTLSLYSHLEAFTSRSMKAWNPQKEILLVDEDHMIPIRLNDDLITRYFYYKGLSYSQSGTAKLMTLQRAMATLKDIGSSWKEYSREFRVLLGTAGLEKFFARDYKEAVKLFQSALQTFTGTSGDDLPLVFNLVNALMKTRQFGEVDQLIDQYEREISRSESLHHRYRIIRCMARIFLNRPEEAFSLLDHDMSRRPVSERYYSRFLFAMVFWLKGDEESAINEIRNLVRAADSTDAYERDMKRVGLLFSRYFTSGEQRGKVRTDLQVKAENLAFEAIPAGEDFLPLLWLRDQLAR